MRRGPAARYSDLVFAVAMNEFLEAAVEESATELVAERVPHDRVHADQPRRQVRNREELHELHVHELGARLERQPARLASHVGGGAAAAEDLRQSTGGEDHGGGGDGRQRSSRQIERHHTSNATAGDADFDRCDIAQPSDPFDAAHLVPERRGDSGVVLRKST